MALLSSSGAFAQVTQRVSIATNGTQGNAQTFGFIGISANGRYVSFCSTATNLIPGGTTSVGHVYLRDQLSGTTELVSVGPGGVQGNNGSWDTSVSADGRFVAFSSLANNLVPGDTNGEQDVFVRDRLNGTTELVSVAADGSGENGYADFPAITPDGRYVAFLSNAQNIVPGSSPDYNVFVRDRLTGTNSLATVDSAGNPGTGGPTIYGPVAISDDGRYVAFGSLMTNLVPGDTNGHCDAFVHDRATGVTERVSLDSSGAQGDAHSGYYGVALSGDGRFVAFASFATNLVPGDTNGLIDVFVRDRLTGTTQRVDVGPGGAQTTNTSGVYGLSLSRDGRYVTFDSQSFNLLPGTLGNSDVFRRDLQTGVLERVSVSSTGVAGSNQSNVSAISADGSFVAFESFAGNLVPGDTNGVADVFVHFMSSTDFTTVCEPGVGGVLACPCSNAPIGPGRGCNNSAATGGAELAASGVAHLSLDNLVFTTSAEKPTGTSVLLQGNAFNANGLVFGQGVRCVAGTLKRLYTKNAVGGSITAPDFGAGDPTVSARSAALGDVIAAGQNRYYLVYYRDPIVLGGCPTLSTFNTTQSGLVTWSP